MAIKEAKVRWVDGMQFVAEASSGHAIVLDGAEQIGGRNTGFRAMELLLAGLAGCMAVSIVSILKKNHQPFRDLEIRVHAAQNDDFPQVYTQFDLECIVYGTNINERIVDLALRRSEEKYCSASAMFSKIATIMTRYSIVEAGV